MSPDIRLLRHPLGLAIPFALVYEATQGLLAGHALKHLVAAAAVWPILAAAGLRQNAPSRARGARAA